ncbi:cathepsin B-like isoform X2 [Lycorma delicatula]
MRFLLITVLAPVIVLARPENELANPFKSAGKWIDIINNDPHSTWKAGQNFDPSLPKSYVSKLLGVKELKNGKSKLPLGAPITDIDDKKLPETFDARKKWKKCKSLQQIRDQGDCGSCWAVGAASAFTDRLCIATNGKFNGHLSAEELMDCCSDCGDGCFGGYPEEAWTHFSTYGIVSGGDFNSSEGCQPYSKQPCEHHVEGPRPKCSSLDPMFTPECSSKCTNSKYTTPFDKDHKKVKSVYTVSSTETAIMKEIYKYGPVEAAFSVYSDFFSYKSGVYQHSSQSTWQGGHAVKLIGWGKEKGVKYWLVQNSWNSDWGDKGLFKIIRGNNECGFESRINAGLPSV